MSKVSTLFSNETRSKVLKPIELVKFIDNDFCTVRDNGHVQEVLQDVHESIFQISRNAKLISRGDVFDIIAVWNEEAEHEKNLGDVGVFLGYWNDGVLP